MFPRVGSVLGRRCPIPKGCHVPQARAGRGDSVCIVVPLDISHHLELYSGTWFTEQIATGLVGKGGQATKKAAEPGSQLAALL